MKDKLITAIDKSVRDHTQKAMLSKDRSMIFVISMVGSRKAWTTAIKMDEWDRAVTFNKYSFNQVYNKREFIKYKTSNLDEQPGGWCQADRIRDSMVLAIDKVLKETM